MFVLVKEIKQERRYKIVKKNNSDIEQACSIYRPDFELLGMDKSNGKFREVTWEEKFADLMPELCDEPSKIIFTYV